MNDIKDQLFHLSTNAEMALGEWILNLVILLALITAIKWVYTKRSNSVSNRALFSNIFYAFSLTIFLIITSIRASLALTF